MKTLLFIFTVLSAQAAFAGDDAGPPAQAASHNRYIVLTAGTTTFSYAVGQTVNVAGAREESLAQAREKALEKCHNEGFPELTQTCHVVFEAHEGCQFIVKGTSAWGTVGWGIGETKQAAYDDCHSKGFDCFVQAYGGCADGVKRRFPDIVESPKIKTYISFAISVVRRKDLNSIYLGSSAGISPDDAAEKSVESCQEGHSEATCQPVKSISHGCMYASIGWIREDEHYYARARYAFGTTKEEAFVACRATGANCVLGEVRGGCAQD